MMCVCSSGKRLAFVRLNLLSSTGQFSPVYHPIVSSLLNFVIFAQTIAVQNRTIDRGASGGRHGRGVRELQQRPADEPTVTFLASLAKLFGLERFVLLCSARLRKVPKSSSFRDVEKSLVVQIRASPGGAVVPIAESSPSERVPVKVCVRTRCPTWCSDACRRALHAAASPFARGCREPPTDDNCV
jgi:hypothetical protein